MINLNLERCPDGKPLIASSGTAVVRSNVPFIQLAAEEINQEVGEMRYEIIIPPDSDRNLSGHRLPHTQQTIRIAGLWAIQQTPDLVELVNRATEVKQDFAHLR